MISTRHNRRPPLASLDPLTLKPLVPTIKTTGLFTADKYYPSPDSSPDSYHRRVPAPVYRTPLTPHRALPLRRSTQCRSEQDDIEVIKCFIKQISRRLACVYKALSSLSASVFHGTVATVRWLAVVAVVIEVMMFMSFSSTPSNGGSGFIVGQLTSTTLATGHANTNPSPHPRTSEALTLNFLSDQIYHAHNLLTVATGLGDDAFFGYHQANVRRFLGRAMSDTLSGGSKTEVNLTVDFRGLDSTLIQSLSSHGFIGRTISHALDEVTYHPKRTQMTFLRRRDTTRESRLDSVFLLTTSNLLLEFSSILSQTESIIPDLEAIHRQLSRNLPEVSANFHSRKAATSRRSIWALFQGVDPRNVEEESTRAFMVGLETTIANLRQLKAYLEWITNNLSQRPFLLSASVRSSHSDQSCSAALQDLLDRAKKASKKSNSCCRCPDSKDSPTAPTIVEFNIPGSSTLRTAN